MNKRMNGGKIVANVYMNTATAGFVYSPYCKSDRCALAAALK